MKKSFAFALPLCFVSATIFTPPSFQVLLRQSDELGVPLLSLTESRSTTAGPELTGVVERTNSVHWSVSPHRFFTFLTGEAKAKARAPISGLEQLYNNFSRLTNLWFYNGYHRYHDLSPVVFRETVKQAVKDLAVQISMLTPTTLSGHLNAEIKNPKIERLFVTCVNLAHEALNDPELSIKDRCWTLAILSCLRGNVIGHGHGATPIRLADSAVSRGELELHLLKDLPLPRMVFQLWPISQSKREQLYLRAQEVFYDTRLLDVQEVLGRVKLLQLVSTKRPNGADIKSTRHFCCLYDYLLLAQLPPSQSQLEKVINHIRGVIISEQTPDWQKEFVHNVCWHLNQYSALFGMELISLIHSDNVFQQNFHKILAKPMLEAILSSQNKGEESTEILPPGPIQSLIPSMSTWISSDETTTEITRLSLDLIFSEESRDIDRMHVFKVVNAASSFNTIIFSAVLKRLMEETVIPPKLVDMWNNMYPGLNFNASGALHYEKFLFLKSSKEVHVRDFEILYHIVKMRKNIFQRDLRNLWVSDDRLRRHMFEVSCYIKKDHKSITSGIDLSNLLAFSDWVIICTSEPPPSFAHKTPMSLGG
ncbi:hypothetical protein CROQUDRAFT_133286 [Cronartium quercuum f. sp. fusiforme G11]|uniref:Uncharacterized protein n=1 Tax=Cronartium quercuum f. sp. fusiforme G11 TaxID=708437 RepID=A0A9P6TC21_9BASI|nr:hypothetical protein CROQUDRAFT_133286 [Cronartium quercuum f. sp. fusiforme G11]